MSAYRKIDEGELVPFHQEVYDSADRLNLYFLLGYFVVGVGISFFHNTWLLAFIMGGSILATYFAVRHFMQKSSLFRIVVSVIFWLFPLQFILQMHGDQTMAFFYFVSLTVLLFNEDKWLLIPVIVGAFLTYIILFTGTVNDEFMGMAMEDLPQLDSSRILQLLIMTVYAVLTSIWAIIQRNQTRQAGISYIQMDEQLQLMDVNIDFANSISHGDLAANYPIDNPDRLGESLMNMRRSLSEASIREQREKFINVGMASIGEILRNHVDNLEVLSDKVIEKLVSYLKSNQGGIFILNSEEGDPYLELSACRAYERKKFNEKKIQIGQGLLGQAFLEQETILMTEIPDDYLSITSGLGISNPRCLLIVPLKSNDETVGVIELASFREFNDTDIEFLEKVAESIASTIISAKTNQKTKELLESSRQMTEEMQAQEEEMRQNMEEMQATQEEMGRTQSELADKEANLNALINNTDDSIITIDKNYKIIVMNDVVKNRYKGTQFEGMAEGSNALEMLGDVKDEWKAYYDRAFAGERYSFVLKSSVNGEDTWREYFLNPIHGDKHEIIGISVFSRDVTDKKMSEQALSHERSLFEALMKNIPDAIYFKDKESKFLRVSDSIVKAFGFDDENHIIGKSDFDFFDEEHARPAYESEQQIMASGEAIMGKIEKEVRSNGSTTWAETFKMPLKNAEGEVIGTFGMSKDITNAKNNENDLVKRTSLLRGLIENTPDSVFTIDASYHLVLANDRVKELFGKAGQKINIGDKVPGEGNWKAYYDRALGGEYFSIEESEIGGKMNGEKYHHILGPVKDEAGTIIGASIISRNLNEKLAAENVATNK